MSRVRTLTALVSLATVALLALSACGGGASDGGGVASADDVERPQTDEADSTSAAEGPQAAPADDGSTETPVDEPAATADTFEDALLQFAGCLREQGVDVDDPDFSGDGPGRGIGGLLRGSDLSRDDPEVQAALEECNYLLEGLRREFDPERQAEREDQLIGFAQCLRGEGLDVDDPDFSSGGGPGGGIFGPNGLNLDDPDVAAALEACQEELPGRFGRGPGGGGAQ